MELVISYYNVSCDTSGGKGSGGGVSINSSGIGGGRMSGSSDTSGGAGTGDGGSSSSSGGDVGIETIGVRL
jgi:hypothetical protein